MADHDEEAVVRDPGRAATLKFTIGLCLCYTLCVACLRGYIRWRAYNLDDLIVLLSGVCTSWCIHNNFEHDERPLLTIMRIGIGA